MAKQTKTQHKPTKTTNGMHCKMYYKLLISSVCKEVYRSIRKSDKTEKMSKDYRSKEEEV